MLTGQAGVTAPAAVAVEDVQHPLLAAGAAVISSGPRAALRLLRMP